MVFVFSVFKNIIHDEKSAVRKLLPGILLAVYATIGAGIFLAVERNGPCPIESFWAAMYYVGTIYTTIGTGNIAPCTTAGRLITVPYTLLGIPIALITLDNIGFVLARHSGRAWERLKYLVCLPIRKIRKKNNILPKKLKTPAKTDDEEAVRPKLPILLGLAITIQWTLLTALLYAATEGWNYFESLYFVFISITTIGFGDISPKRFHWCILQYAFLMVDLALFSMNINILQESLENLTGRISDAIMAQYLEKLQNDETGEFNQIDLEDKEKAKQSIRDTIRKQPGGKYLQFFISKKAEQGLIAQLQEKGRMRNKGIQVAPEIVDTAADATILTSDFSTQVSLSKEARIVAVKDRGQQLDWLPKMRFEHNWLDVHGYSKKDNKISKQSKKPRKVEVGHSVKEKTPQGSFHRKSSEPSSSQAASAVPTEFSNETAGDVDSDVFSDVNTI